MFTATAAFIVTETFTFDNGDVLHNSYKYKTVPLILPGTRLTLRVIYCVSRIRHI